MIAIEERSAGGAPRIWERARRSVTDRLARNWVLNALPCRAAAPVVSFSFDDFPRSAVTEGAPILAQYGMKATYFASGARAGSQVEGRDHYEEDDLVALAEAGHEIGCHTFAHINLPQTDRKQIEDDLARNQDFFHRVLGPYRTTSFAYPFGAVSIATKKLIGARFPNCRGIFPGINRNRIDPMQLKAAPLEQRSFQRAAILRLIAACEESRGWLIFFTHDVSDNPSPFGITPDDLAFVAETLAERKIGVMTIRDAASEICPQEHPVPMPT